MTDHAENEALVRKIRDEQMKMAPDAVNLAAGVRTAAQLSGVAPRTHGVMDEQFPTEGLTAYDERDKVMEAKLALQDPARPGYTKFGKLDAKDEDFKWLAKKQAVVEAANFQQWFAKEFDRMSPAEKKRAKELYPEFYAQRKKLLKKQTKNLFDLARIKLEGIESKEDLMKTYMAETGRLDVGPLKHLLNPEQDDSIFSDGNNKKRFQRGLANPWTVFGKEALPANVTTRAKEARIYAARNYPADAQTYGATSGFPPMGSQDTNQGDAAWYQVLSQGVAQ